MNHVNPNRMELSRQKKRLATAKKGHKLLKDKQDALIKIFMEKVKEASSLRQNIEEGLKSAYPHFISAASLMEGPVFLSSFIASGIKPKVERSIRNIMGIKTPEYECSIDGSPYTYGFVGTSAELDISIGVFSGALNKMIRLSQVQKALELMSEEIESTRRRVNALEYALIPRVEETIRYIKMKLDELERGSLSQLMRIKEMVIKD